MKKIIFSLCFCTKKRLPSKAFPGSPALSRMMAFSKIRFKNVGYASYSDWRLPVIGELKALVYCSTGRKSKDDSECNDGAEKLTINQQAFPNTQSVVWSGSPHAANSGYAWVGNFNDGNSYSFYRDPS